MDAAIALVHLKNQYDPRNKYKGSSNFSRTSTTDKDQIPSVQSYDLKGVPKWGSIYPQALKFCPKLKNLSPSPLYFEKLSSSLMLVRNNLSSIL